LLEECVELRRKLGDRPALGNSLRSLGNVLFDIGDLVKTRDLYEQALATYKGCGDDAGTAAVLNNLGVLASYEEDWERAETLYEEAFSFYKARDDMQGIARSLMNLGDVKVEQGDFTTAASHLHDSFVMFQQLRSRWDIAYLLEGMANVMRAQDRAEDAAKLFGSAEILRERLGAPLPPSETTPYERIVAKVASSLEPSVFSDAWAKGRAMDMDEAVAYALSLR
jgi:tetratricopeptide (TPR) repeat protein